MGLESRNQIDDRRPKVRGTVDPSKDRMIGVEDLIKVLPITVSMIFFGGLYLLTRSMEDLAILRHGTLPSGVTMSFPSSSKTIDARTTCCA